MKRPQFSLRAILWAMLVAALLFGWGVDRTRLSTGLDAERQHRAALETDLQAQAADAEKYKSDRDAYKEAYFRKLEIRTARHQAPAWTAGLPKSAGLSLNVHRPPCRRPHRVARRG